MANQNAKLVLLSCLLAGSFFSIPVHPHDNYNDYLSLLGFTLEKANFNQIRKTLGNAPIFHSGDAGNSYYAICYTSERQNATVIFESGEMGGTDHTLLSFVVEAGIDPSRTCKELTGQNINLDAGTLSLNKNFDSVKRTIPKPVTNINNGIQHNYHGKIPFTKQDIENSGLTDLKYAFWDVYIVIELYEKNGILDGFKVSKLTSG